MKSYTKRSELPLTQLIESYRIRNKKVLSTLIHYINKSPRLNTELTGLTNFLDLYYSDISIQQRLYHLWFNRLEIERCPYCGKPRRFFNKFSTDRHKSRCNYSCKTCQDQKCKTLYIKVTTADQLYEKYGVTNPADIPGWLDKVKDGTRKKYGVDFYMQAGDFKKKSMETNLQKYGVEHVLQNDEVMSRLKQTNLERYRSEFPQRNHIVKKKREGTNLIKYGGVSPLSNSIIKEKGIKSNLIKYGTKNAAQSEIIKNKIKRTVIRKYGVPYTFQSEVVKNAIRKTNLLKYGSEYRLQNAEQFDQMKKSLYKKFDYSFPSGRIEKVQGYEPFAIDDLLKQGFEESDIVIRNKSIDSVAGQFWYEVAGKRHRYYPDIYIRSLNLIIEVKSGYTAKRTEFVNELKGRSVIDRGINFEFWVYDHRGVRINKNENH